jgi:hypothetical protein
VESGGIAWLVGRPPRTRADAALTAGRGQPRVVLEVMRAEGLVQHLGAGIYLPSDAHTSCASRAAAFDSLVPTWGVLAMEAAAWVHGGPRPSAPFVVLTDSALGPKWLPEGVRVRESSLPDDDVQQIGGLRITSPARTAADLARWGDGPSARESLHWLLSGVTSVAETRAVLVSQTRFRHNRRARPRLRAVHRGEDDAGLWPGAGQPTG